MATTQNQNSTHLHTKEKQMLNNKKIEILKDELPFPLQKKAVIITIRKN